jgi:hypothetical protein
VKPEIQLIQLFLWVCAVYDKHPALKYQRWSTNTTEPLFTDQEALTIYLFGHLQERFKLKSIHRYIQQHWSDWFPQLPSYQAFNHRLNLLEDVWPVLLSRVAGSDGNADSSPGDRSNAGFLADYAGRARAFDQGKGCSRSG